MSTPYRSNDLGALHAYVSELESENARLAWEAKQARIGQPTTWVSVVAHVWLATTLIAIGHDLLAIVLRAVSQ